MTPVPGTANAVPSSVTLYPSPDVPAGGATVKFRDSSGEQSVAIAASTPVTVSAERALALMEAGIAGVNGEPGQLMRLVPSVEAYGHSHIAGAGASDSTRDVLHRFAKKLGNLTINSVSQNGGFAAHSAANGGTPKLLQGGLATTLTAGPYVTKGGVKLCSIGANDAPTYSAVLNGNTIVEGAMRLAYSRLLAARIIKMNTGAALNTAECTYSAGWTAAGDTTLSIPSGYAYHTTGSPYVEFTLDGAYNGEAITAALILGNVNATYTATLAINGVTQTSLSTGVLQTALNTAGVANAVVALRIPAGVAVAGQTIRLTMSAITGFALVTGFIIEGNSPPPLILPGLPLEVGDAPQITNATYQNARVQAIKSEFPSAVYVDLAPARTPHYPASDADAWSTTVVGHANDVGHERDAYALASAARPLLTPAVAARMGT